MYLIARGEPIAVGPPPARRTQALAVFEDGRMISALPLPVAANYQRLVGAIDVTGDGRHEVLLETAFFHMGQLVVSLDVVSLDDNGAGIQRRVENVYEDNCSAPSGEPAVVAKVVAMRSQAAGGNALMTRNWRAACRESREGNGSDFIPVDDNNAR